MKPFTSYHKTTIIVNILVRGLANVRKEKVAFPITAHYFSTHVVKQACQVALVFLLLRFSPISPSCHSREIYPLHQETRITRIPRYHLLLTILPVCSPKSKVYSLSCSPRYPLLSTRYLLSHYLLFILYCLSIKIYFSFINLLQQGYIIRKIIPGDVRGN